MARRPCQRVRLGRLPAEAPVLPNKPARKILRSIHQGAAEEGRDALRPSQTHQEARPATTMRTERCQRRVPLGRNRPDPRKLAELLPTDRSPSPRQRGRSIGKIPLRPKASSTPTFQRYMRSIAFLSGRIRKRVGCKMAGDDPQKWRSCSAADHSSCAHVNDAASSGQPISIARKFRRAHLTMPISTVDFRFPGVLNSKEMLVAEAIHARAWESISNDLRIAGASAEEAKARLGRIVTQLMGNGPKAAVGDLTAAAVRAFKEETTLGRVA